MISISNNSYSTLVLSVAILLFPTFVLLSMSFAVNITAIQKAIFLGLSILTLLFNFWFNFLIYRIYFDPKTKQIIIKQLGRTIYKTAVLDINVNYINIYAVPLANFTFQINGKKFRFRSKFMNFSALEWWDKEAMTKKIRADIFTRIGNI